MSAKLLLVAVIAFLSGGASAMAAQIQPFRSAQKLFTVPISSGCGIGINRGPYDACDIIYRDSLHSKDGARSKPKFDDLSSSVRGPARKKKTATDVKIDNAVDNKLGAKKATTAAEKLAGESAIADVHSPRASESISRVVPSPPMPPELSEGRFQDHRSRNRN